MSERKKQFLCYPNSQNKTNRNNPEHFLFFDTETQQEFTRKMIGKKTYKVVINKLDIGWACYYNAELGTEEWRYFETIKEFYTFVSRCITLSGKKQLWIIAHNIVFDNIITDIWTFLEDKKFESDFIHSKGMVFIQTLKRYEPKLRKDKKGNMVRKLNKKILLVNNGNIFPAKLETIGQVVGFPKLEIDFKKCTKEELKIYCKRDVEILVEFWKSWIKFISDNELGNLKFTISSQSMEAFKKKFCKNFIVIDNDMKNLDFERLSYFGGRTEIFYKGKVNKKIHYYDVNSMYPHVMREFVYPTEFKYFKNNPELWYVEEKIKKGMCIIAECYIETETNNCYPVKENGTLLFPLGKFKTYLATPEVVEGLKNGDIKSFGRVSFYKASNIFKDYIDFFYNFRLELKKAGNPQEKMVKLFLNSLYGKFGQKMDKWIKTTLEEIEMLVPSFDLDMWIMDEFKIPKIVMNGQDMTPKIRYIGTELQMSGEEEEGNISFPAIASHVTSYARLIIWEGIKWCKVNNETFYYCDTDSMFIDGELPNTLVDPNTLGKFKVEHIYENGVEFMNLKNYCPLNEKGEKVVQTDKLDYISIDEVKYVKDSKIIKGDEWRMKGVPNGAEMINENKFITEEWGGLPKQEYYRKFGRQDGEFWVIYKEKSNHGTINKGDLQTSGEIKPFNFNRWIS